MNQDNKEDDHMKFYREALGNLIKGESSSSATTTFDMESYIAVFSMYMCYSNDAYKYNLPYLSEQHKKFTSFIGYASKKYKRLQEIVEAINASTIIKEYIKANPDEVENIKICLNNFLKSNVCGTISFHEELSFSGAEHNSKNDIITILYNDSIRSCKLPSTSSLNLKDEYGQVVEQMEKILVIYKESGGH